METPQLYIDLILLMVQRISSSVKVSLWISLKFLIRVDFPALAGPNTSILHSNFRSVVPLDFFPGLFSLVLLLNLRYGLTDGGSFWFASRLQLSCTKKNHKFRYVLDFSKRSIGYWDFFIHCKNNDCVGGHRKVFSLHKKKCFACLRKYT